MPTLCFALTPFAAHGARWMRLLAWIVAVIQFSLSHGTHDRHDTRTHRRQRNLPAARAGILFVSISFHWIGLADDPSVADRCEASTTYAGFNRGIKDNDRPRARRKHAAEDTRISFAQRRTLRTKEGHSKNSLACFLKRGIMSRRLGSPTLPPRYAWPGNLALNFFPSRSVAGGGPPTALSGENSEPLIPSARLCGACRRRLDSPGAFSSNTSKPPSIRPVPQRHFELFHTQRKSNLFD